MISKNRISLIRSLETKKSRDKQGLFIAEGEKICHDLIHSGYQIQSICFTGEWKMKYTAWLDKMAGNIEIIEVSEAELKKISMLATPNKVLAVVHQKEHVFSWPLLSAGPVVLLDQIQDPGNLGTIIRTADWFGFKMIIASADTADLYNAKVVQSAMGSLFRIPYFKADLELLLHQNRMQDRWPVFTAVLEGKNMYSQKLSENGFYLFGNEANGVSLSLQSLSSDLITIPKHTVPGGKQPADSLNVAVAAAVVMAEQVRQTVV